MTVAPFPDRARVDAYDKVRGVTRFAADVPVDGLLHAMTVPATIAKGRVTSIDTDAAVRVPGVVRVLTWRDLAGAGSPNPPEGRGFGFHRVQPMSTDRIAYRGEPVALVVAETLEAAIEAAALVRPAYAAEPFAATMDHPGAEREAVADSTVRIGDADAALDASERRIEASYFSPLQFHNPMEPISTTAAWDGDRVTIYEGTQSSANIKFGVADVLGLDPAAVHVQSPYVGGAFGQKNTLQAQTVLVVRAAMLTGRPVKLVMPRAQLFRTATFRPAAKLDVRLGADRDGRLVAVRFHGEHHNARAGNFEPGFHEMPSRLYGVENYHGTGAVVRIDTQPPGHMRAPREHPGVFAYECAVDEMAYALGRDPLDFRLAHDVDRDLVADKPFSSRHLAECLRRGGERFGWSRRTPAPGSMTAPDGSPIGWGVASGAYQAATTPVIATFRVYADGRSRLSLSGHEMGQGIRTAITAALLAKLDIDPDRLEVRIGDTSAAPQHLTAGSWGTASAVPAASEAATRMRAALSELLAGRRIPGNMHRVLARVRRPYLEVRVSRVAPGQPRAALDRLRSGRLGRVGPEYPEFSGVSFIAHFVEVRVEPRTRRVRVPRVVSVADCGRVVSPRTAASQVHGGVIWALGAALREAAEVDPRYGGVLNNDLADYIVPVNADVGDIDVTFIDEPDPLLNEVGVKGLGEVGMVGAAAAIANAVFHATGTRLRRLPMRVEDLL